MKANSEIRERSDSDCEDLELAFAPGFIEWVTKIVKVVEETDFDPAKVLSNKEG